MISMGVKLRSVQVLSVYPTLAPQTILGFPADQIVDAYPRITAKLGKSISVPSSPDEFADKLQSFTTTHMEDVELWPLIAQAS